MERISAEGKILIFLNHRILIAEAYNKDKSIEYTLRPELFDFQPKNYTKIEKQTEVEIIPKKKRRKVNIQHPDEAVKKTRVINNNDELIAMCYSVQSKLKGLIKDQKLTTPIKRFWEELNTKDFPSFKGANCTTSFQVIDNLVKDKHFLIPPNTSFYNYDIGELTKHLKNLAAPFDFIVLDPPWRNKYIRRLKRYNLGYNMLDNKHLQEMPIKDLINSFSIVAVWCTNSKQHQQTLLKELMPSWNLRPLHAVKWLKLNTLAEPISMPTSEQKQKQPYEMLYIACHQDAKPDFGASIKEVDLVLSVPSVIHSHKPPLLTWFHSYFNFGDSPKCLELFARYLQPHFTSFGLEVLKLMDKRLYVETKA